MDPSINLTSIFIFAHKKQYKFNDSTQIQFESSPKFARSFLMINPQLYKPQQLHCIEQNNKYPKHPELYLKPQILVQEKQFIKQILYMLQGLQTQLFVRVYDQVEFDQEKGDCQRVFHFILRQDYRTLFTHLTHDTIKACSQTAIKLANYMYYLNSKSRMIYERTSNPILKSFSEGIMHFFGRINSQFTSILTQLQKQIGKICNLNLANDSSAFEWHTEQISLLKITYLFDSKIKFISELVGIVSKVLPFSLSSSQQYPTDNYQVILILFNELTRLIDLIELNDREKNQILLIYQSSLIFYISIIQDWIEMNPYVLESKKGLPFFIQLPQVNFSLSKSTNTSNVYKKIRSAAFMTEELKEEAFKSEQFVELFFKLDNLLIEEYLPQMFKKQGSCILELGKIIQFIYLYFSVEEKPLLEKYFSVQQQFKRLFDIFQFQKAKSDLLDHSFHQCQKSSFLSHMPMKKKQQISISERLGEKIRKPYRNVRVFGDNPYNMFQNTRGAFLDYETTVPSIKVEFQSSKSQPNSSLSSKNSIQMDQEQSHQQYPSSETFSIKFERILSEIIQKLYEKTIYFFQQQSDREFFKLESHININSESIIEHENHSVLQKRNHLISMHKNLALLPNHERVIQSISLTLIGIKKFMLYEQGDFFLQLISMVHNIFQNSSSKISRSLINSLIDEAIKNSSAKDLPQDMRSKVSFLFLKKSKDPEIRHLKVWSVFSTLYRPEFPVNCIFNSEIMQGFGQIFNFIFNIKQCEHSLKTIWDDFKQNGKIQTQYSLFQIKKHPYESKILAVRNNMHHFMNLIFGFVMISVETLWTEYVQEINLSFLSNHSMEQNLNEIAGNKKLHNPISLIKLTNELLKNLKGQTTNNTILTNTMILICELLNKFKKLLKIVPDSKEWNGVMFKQEIEYIGHQFMGIMDLAKGIDGIGDAIFYNNNP